jgi:hypothetical protein
VRRTIGNSLVVAAMLLTGCNGNSTANTIPCAPPSGIQTVLVYPAPGSSGLPDNLGQVVLGSTGALPSTYQAYLINNATQNAVAFNLVGTPPNPLPTPDALPTFANPVYQASANPGGAFVSGSAISVYLNNANSGCVPTVSLGTFTVQ